MKDKSKSVGTAKPRSVNMAKKADSLDGHDGTPQGIKKLHELRKQCLAPAPESAEERFAEAVAGLDATTIADLQKLAGFYGDIMIFVWAYALSDNIPCRRTKTRLREIFRGVVGPANSVDAFQFLRGCLQLMFGFSGGELRDMMQECQAYAEPRVSETVNRLNVEMRSLRSTTAGTALLYTLELDNAPFRESAKRLGTSAANICQQAKRIERRLPWRKLNRS